MIKPVLLTEGKLEINEVQTCGEHDKEEILKIACSIESKSKTSYCTYICPIQKDHSIELEEVEKLLNQ